MRKYFMIFLLVIVGCNHIDDHPPIAKNDFYSKEWNTVNIRLERQEITFFNDTDSSYSKTWSYKDTLNKNNELLEIPINLQTVKFGLNKSDRNTLFSNIYDLIKNPVNPKVFCTDYVGNVTFKIKYKQVTIGCTYSSICTWDSLSPRVLIIKKVLDKKIKLLEQ